jgi:fructose-1,6-bisphosphatase I
MTPDRKILTLEQYIIEGQKLFPHARGEFSQLLRDIGLAARLVNREVNRAGLVDILGDAGNENIQGEQVKKLDVFANTQFIEALRMGGQVCAIGSEENDEIIPVHGRPGNYVVLMDPLDGSANIDANIPVGTIFSIYRRVTEAGPGTLADALQPGRNQVCAGYVIYGSSTILVITTGQGVHGFTLDLSVGEFFLSHRNIRVPVDSTYYSINEGKYPDFSPELKAYLADVKARNAEAGSPLIPRYVGSLVADFHRNLLKGGIFIYPGSSYRPQGKLRLMYEANPLAYLMEQAGGYATDGLNRVLEIVPTGLHQRTPLFVGSEDEMTIVHRFLNREELVLSGQG